MKTISLFVFLALVAFSCAVAVHEELRSQFLSFQQQYHKVYETAGEFEYRFQIFQENLKRAAENQKKNPLARFGVTKFSDLTQEEFKASFLNPKIKDTLKSRPARPFNSSIPRPLNRLGCNPNSYTYDWFADCQGSCTGIYNQGSCGSCWAFSATETIESYYALYSGPLTALSMQQMVDCDTGDGGCSGGVPQMAFYYVESVGGLEPYADYPYVGYDQNCQFQKGEVAVTVDSYSDLSGESGIYSQLSSSSGGPVSVCVDANTWDGYQGGILTNCGDNVDHCVVVTGYNSYGSSNNYWIVRNSWGENWGENGFIFIIAGQNMCDIALSPAICSTSSV